MPWPLQSDLKGRKYLHRGGGSREEHTVRFTTDLCPAPGPWQQPTQSTLHRNRISGPSPVLSSRVTHVSSRIGEENVVRRGFNQQWIGFPISTADPTLPRAGGLQVGQRRLSGCWAPKRPWQFNSNTSPVGSDLGGPSPKDTADDGQHR